MITATIMTQRQVTDLGKLFSMMDNSPLALMFADQSLTLRRTSPLAVVIFKPLEQFLPTQVENLAGYRIDIFHKKPEIIRKIVSNPRNLPYRTQVIIGPKTLDLEVKPVYDDGDHHYLGVMAYWSEILPGA